jgi:hypothetical protein
MNSVSALRPLAENLWFLPFPLKMLGVDVRRNVTVIALLSGDLIIHSSGPFSTADVAAIRGLGQPVWLLDGILRHDTFAKEGRAAFPEAEYLAPPGFSEVVGFPTSPILPVPPHWNGEILALELAGSPEAKEVAFLHIPSRTLILTELIFNFNDDQPLWTELLLRVAVGGEHHPGMPRPVKAGVKDEAAFKASLNTIEGWDFDRIVVGHGDVIESGGKDRLRAALKVAGF